MSPDPSTDPAVLRTRESTRRFPEDAYLRRHGWSILERRNGKTPLWIRQGEVMAHEQALEASGWVHGKREAG